MEAGHVGAARWLVSLSIIKEMQCLNTHIHRFSYQFSTEPIYPQDFLPLSAVKENLCGQLIQRYYMLDDPLMSCSQQYQTNQSTARNRKNNKYKSLQNEHK